MERVHENLAALSTNIFVPPHDIDAERAVLGAMLLDNECITAVRALVADGDFYHPSHALICRGLYALSQEGKPADVVTLSDWLRGIDRLNTVGGGQYISELGDTIASIAHVEAHAVVVSDLSRVRRAIVVAQMFVAECRESGGYNEALSRTIREMADLATRRGRRVPKSMADIASKEFDPWLDARLKSGRKISGVETGFHELDMILGGLPNGLITIAARPSMGKSAFEFEAAAHIAQTQGPVLCFSLEMAALDKFAREVCARSGAEYGLMRNGYVPKELLDDVYARVNELSKLPLWVQDDATITLEEVCAQTKQWKIKHDIKAMFIDYLQLLKLMMNRGMSRQEAVSEMTRSLKVLSGELQIPVVALSQLNRDCEKRDDKRPQLSDLRESGAIEQDSDVVIFLYRDEVYNKESMDKGIAEVSVAKQRNGPCDTVRLLWDGPLMKFTSRAIEDGFEAEPSPDLPAEDAGQDSAGFDI